MESGIQRPDFTKPGTVNFILRLKGNHWKILSRGFFLFQIQSVMSVYVSQAKPGMNNLI